IKLHPRISPFLDLVAIPRLWRAMWKLSPTIVHAHTLKAGLLGMIAATMARVPVRIFHVHGLPHLGARGLLQPILFLATKMACVLAHRVFCVSPSIMQVLIDEAICPQHKVVVPVNGSCDGIDALESFNPAGTSTVAATAIRALHGIPASAFAMAFIGRLVRHKGLIELCQAWKVLRSNHPTIHLLIVGDFEPEDQIPQHVVQVFRDDRRVHMTGLCTNMPELYKSIDLLVLPSYYEGFPTVLLEAAAMGLPAIATAIPGSVDAVRDNVTGILVPPYNVLELARAIEGYINDPSLGKKHGSQARLRMLSEFRPEPIRAFTYEEYDRMLSQLGLCSPPIPEAGPQLTSDGTLNAGNLS
ncbi:MAG: putative Capsular polysaccharide biosynthesis glycosyltransferase CapM, partial [Bryobacterales bacterium]|nr:putative Capsular polysaccharide biosynthesis glycosyltransferase CapM [Bryobacterales bacterium]